VADGAEATQLDVAANGLWPWLSGISARRTVSRAPMVPSRSRTRSCSAHSLLLAVDGFFGCGPVSSPDEPETDPAQTLACHGDA
jgi:hypothetical protein